MTDPAVFCRGLTRDFGGLRAVADLNLEIDRGDVFAFLGPNGAGKTTTLRLLIGLISPTAGSVRVLGLDPGQEGDRVRAQIGVLLEDPGLYDELTGYDNLEYYARLNRLGQAERADRIRVLLERHELWDRRGERVRSFSKGMKQRLALARAMIGRPRVLFLDEPTSGLDPAATRRVRETMLALAQEEEITVFLNTHNLDEVERVSNKVGIIKEGRLLAFGSSREIRQRASQGWVRVRTEGIPAAAADRVRELPGIREVAITGREIRAVLGNGTKPSDLVRFLVTEGVAVSEVREEGASLEEVFLQIVEEEG